MRFGEDFMMKKKGRPKGGPVQARRTPVTQV